MSLLKPLCGAEPFLRENLQSFAHQDYRGPFEILFGLHAANDAAAPIVRDVLHADTARPHRLIVDATLWGPNRKVSNLANLCSLARGEVMVLADSDMKVGRGYLSGIVALLQRPGIGLVTCLYRGRPAGGPWSRLGALGIDHHFLPSVVVGLRLGLAKPCFGSTIALKAETLRRIGGIAAFAGTLADDYAVGRAVRALGLSVAVAPMVLDHTCAAASLRELLTQELRWARTIRSIDPWGFAGLIITYPLAFALIGLLSAPLSLALPVLAAALASRLLLQIQVDRVLGRSVGGAWWGPIRDLMSFAVFVGGLWPGPIAWRGHRYRIARGGTLNVEEAAEAEEKARSEGEL